MFPPLLMSPALQIQMAAEAARPESPPYSEPHLPEDIEDFWEDLDRHGWGSDHDMTAHSQEGYTVLSFVLFYAPSLMPEVLALVENHSKGQELINRRDPFGHHVGWTPLHWAARLFQGHAWVPSLLDLGADPVLGCDNDDEDMEMGPAALGLLMLSFNPRMQQFFRQDIEASKVAAQVLIDRGSILGYTCEAGVTPLHAAAQYAPHLVPLLLAHPDGKACVNVLDGYSNTPLVRGLIHHPEVCDLLLDAGSDPWMTLPRTDGAFTSAVDAIEKLIDGRLGSPTTFAAQGVWHTLLGRMNQMKR